MLTTLLGFAFVSVDFLGLGVNRALSVLSGILLLGFLALVYYIVHKQRIGKKLSALGLPELPPSGARLCCVAVPEDILQYGDFRDVPFEPRVFKASCPLTVYANLGWVLGFMFLMSTFTISILHREFVYAFVALLSMIVVIVLLLRPTYFRVVPGRLEVLRFFFLRRWPRSVDSYTLRQAKIVADLRRGMVVIAEGDLGSEYAIWFMPDRNRFVHSLFLAAISTQPVPDLPVDALLG